MQKLKMQSADITAQNIEKIAALFPNCVTEREHNGKLEQAIDFDLLKQELSRSIVEGKQERYQLNWVGKADATVLANTPINKTLRPCREESVNFDSTQNLFIEGDNLDALKLLQETYLGKVKMIYIDPPYNTGKDFIYKDNFAMENGEYQLESGQVDEEGNRLVVNSESNGRFHSDWLSMMYSRLKLARNLLTDDGVIFISIDDNEQANLKRICDEVFGNDNLVGEIVVVNNPRGRDYGGIAKMHEYLLSYKKTQKAEINNLENKNKEFPFNDHLGGFELRELRNRNIAFNRDNRPNLYYPFYVNENSQLDNGLLEISLEPKSGFKEVYPKMSQGFYTVWRWGKEKAQQNINIEIAAKKMNDGGFMIVEKYRKTSQMARSVWAGKEDNSEKGTLLVKELFLGKKYFDFPKSEEMIRKIIQMGANTNDIILDFFAGSATTAHAVMQLNAEDGGNRKFIMVQIPEQTDEKSEAHKAGYKTIAEISKERIRRAGQKIVQELADNQKSTEHLDIGFRVLKIDSSNMADIYYNPQQLQQGDMFNQVEHIKADRSEEDLLFQVLLDWGVDLTLPIEKRVINGKNVFFVDQSVLVACFDKEIDEELIKAITQYQPLRAVFRDDGFINDTTKINAEQLFKQLAPHSELRVI